MTTLPLLGVETPPTSLRLPVGESVWGIDPSTSRIALVIIQGQGPDKPPELGWFHMPVQEVDKGPYRLRELRRDLRAFYGQYKPVAPPVVVCVEQPFAGGDKPRPGEKRPLRPHPQSYFIVGVTLEVTADTFADSECVVETVDPMGWKRDALGAGLGAAKKSQVLGWAQEHGLPVDCPKCHGQGRTSDCGPNVAHDIADAGGIATAAAVRLLARRGGAR